jgi:diguanylate cyclase (GGDEF)-like protein
MIKPGFPQNEEERLKILEALNILDTPSEERFDRLTRLVKKIFRVPIALVSFVDANRQWFKSCIGLDVQETSRDISFCGHVILGDSIFVINDATKDVRFADNPLVVGKPYIRFYAGCPLRIMDKRLGTFCIVDIKPRTFSEEDRSILTDLAAMVEREIEAIQLATIDELTAITNRRGFFELTKKSLSLCSRQGIPAALIFFDLDNFKPINDQYGHAEGDAALIAFAENLKNTFRDSDVIARLGGDEFAVLLINASESQAEKLIERFSATLNHYNTVANRGYHISFSYGTINIKPDQNLPIDNYLTAADSSMYQKKIIKKMHR